MRRFGIVLFFLSLYIIIPGSQVSACQNVLATHFLEDNLAASGIVRGVLLDNDGINYTLRVEEYLLGERGENELLLQRESLALIEVSNQHEDYSIGCFYGLGNIHSDWAGYYFLNRNDNGTYDVIGDYPIIEGQVTYEVCAEEDYHGGYCFDTEHIQVTESEFRELINGLFPDRIAPYYPSNYDELRHRVLYITTENGTQYMLPIDSIVPVEYTPHPCDTPCHIYTPNQLNYVVDNNDGTLTIGDWHESLSGESLEFDPIIEAEAFTFSDNSQFILTRTGDAIELIELRNTMARYDGLRVSTQTIARWQYMAGDTVPIERFGELVAWSADGQSLVYWDAEGLWYFSFYNPTTLSLVIPMDELIAEREQFNSDVLDEPLIPSVLELSSDGRFIRYGNDEVWILLDIDSNIRYFRALISPDENHMVQVGTYNCIGSVCPVEECPVQMTSNGCDIYTVGQDTDIQAWAWLDEDMFAYVLCDDLDTERCGLYSYNFETAYPRTVIIEGTYFDVAFDRVYGLMAYVYGEFDLFIGRDEFDNSFLNFADSLDSPIADIQWGEPVWYTERWIEVDN